MSETTFAEKADQIAAVSFESGVLSEQMEIMKWAMEQPHTVRHAVSEYIKQRMEEAT